MKKTIVKKIKYGDRGLFQYGKPIKVYHECYVDIHKSSLATDNAVWLELGGREIEPKKVIGGEINPSVQVNVQQAKKIVLALTAFIEDFK